MADPRKRTNGWVRGEGTVVWWKSSKSPATNARARKTVTLPDGTTKEIYGYGPTKNAAKQDRDDRIKLALRANPSLDTITIAQLARKFLKHKQATQA